VRFVEFGGKRWWMIASGRWAVVEAAGDGNAEPNNQCVTGNARVHALLLCQASDRYQETWGRACLSVAIIQSKCSSTSRKSNPADRLTLDAVAEEGHRSLRRPCLPSRVGFWRAAVVEHAWQDSDCLPVLRLSDSVSKRLCVLGKHMAWYM